MPSTSRCGVDSALPKLSLPVRSSNAATSVNVPPISAASRKRDERERRGSGIGRGSSPHLIWKGWTRATLRRAKNERRLRRGTLVVRDSERGQALFQIVRQQRHAQQIRGGAPVVGTRRLGAQIVPLLDAAIAAAEPCQGDEIDLLVLVEAEYRCSELGD